MVFIRTIVALSLASLVLAAPSAQSEKRQVGGVIDDVNAIVGDIGDIFSAAPPF